MENMMPANPMNGTEIAKLRGQAISLRNAPKATEAQLNKTAEDFEAVFLSQMLEQMFAEVETNELFGGGEGEDVYRSFMIEEYGKMIAKTGGIGVADHVKAEMLRMQEVGGQMPVMSVR
ncbi:MAG: rod-binding protein [Rickettsiales bacterium]